MIGNYTNGGRALCFWSWNYDLEEKEIKQQLGEFAQGRFKGVVIHARAGLRTPYLQEEWFHFYGVALEECKRLGLDVWIYDEDGWPSGFAGGIVPALGEQHHFKRLCYGKGRKCLEKGHFLAAYSAQAHASSELSRVERTVTGNFGLTQASEVTARADVCGNIKNWVRIKDVNVTDDDWVFWYESDAHYVDLLCPQTVRAFIDATHEQYKARFSDYFGSVIKGVFTDEPQVNGNLPWSHGLPVEFAQHYGYDLMDNLVSLVEETETSIRLRRDFWMLIGNLMKRSYTDQIADWCEQNDLMMTGHFSAEDGLCNQVGANGGVMTHYTAMQLPGIDYLGNRITSPILIKQLSSAARQTGKHDTLSETFGCSGWGISFSRLSWIWGWQSVLGVTTPCFHLAAYSIQGRRKRDYPTFFSYQSPWWDSFSLLTGWIEGLNSLMREGERVLDTLLISPLESVMSSFDPNGSGSGRMERYSSQFRQLAENLLENQIDFDIGDERIMAALGSVQGGKLKVGEIFYSTVIVSECLSLSEPVSRLLREFSEEGGVVAFVGEKPELTNMNTSQGAKIKADIIQNRRELLMKWFRMRGIAGPVVVCGKKSTKPLKNIALHTRRVEGKYRTHVWTDAQFCAGEHLLTVDGCWNIFEIYPLTGESKPLNCYYSNGKTIAPVMLEARANAVFEAVPGVAALQPELKPIRENSAEDVRVSLCAPNCLTIDQARYSINNGDFSEKMPVIHIIDRMYAGQPKDEFSFDANLEYTFFISSDCPLSGMTVVLEDLQVSGITVNGRPVDTKRLGWWIDKGMGEYSLDGLLKPGENKVVLNYKISSVAKNVDINEVFETERNRFCYPVEPDSIYIRGNFDVIPKGEIQNRLRYYSVSDDGFVLDAPTPKLMGDLSAQGLWFYSGDVEYSFKVQKPSENRRLHINVSSLEGVLAIWKIGEKEGILNFYSNKCDITDALAEGENTVILRIKGTHRNLMGPHHHINGELDLVGPSSFQGHRGFEDFISPELRSDNTWTDAYSFIPFGCDGIYLTETAPRSL